jgi:hypothetical protein
VIGVTLTVSGLAGERQPEGWERARSSYRAAGDLVGRGELRGAEAYLSYCAGELPREYRGRTRDLAKQVKALAAKRKSLDKYDLSGELSRLCLRLGAYAQSLRLAREARKRFAGDPGGHTAHLAWCLIEAGKFKAARAELKRRGGNSDSLKRQLDLAERLAAKPHEAELVLEYVREHYLAARGDHLGALDRLTLALSGYHSDKVRRLALYAAVFSSLESLGDSKALKAWEDRLLTEFPRDRGARSRVQLARGIRALKRKDPVAAVDQLTRVLAVEVRTGGKGPRPPADYLDRRHRAALLIADCHELRKDYAGAHRWAVAARDRYKPGITTGARAAIASRRLAKRIRDLAEKVSEASAPRGRRL